MSRKIVALLFVVALLATACQPIHPESAPSAGGEAASAGGSDLIGTQWILTTLNGAPLVAGTTVTAQFDDQGRISGTGGCNSYSGSYTVDGSALTIGPNLISTMMACVAEGVMEQEAAYLAALPTVASYAVDGDTLTLSGADGSAVLVFQAQGNALAGVNWIVTGYNNGAEAVVSPMVGTEITLAFSADGSVSGNAGCNNYMGSYTLDGDKITIGPLATTRKMCAEDVMQQEALYIKALESSATWSVTQILTTRNADDAMAINAAPAE